MIDIRKQKLIDLGAEALADTILMLSRNSGRVEMLIEQMLATEEEAIEDFTEQLARYKDQKDYYAWDETYEFAGELEMLLQGIKAKVSDPLTGMELIASFFEEEAAIFELCDDSSGYIAEVFRTTAKNLFIDYAAGYHDPDKTVEIILRVNEKDNYGVRDALIECAGECVPESVIRSMIAALQKLAAQADKEYDACRYVNHIENLAKQTGDPVFFENIITTHRGGLSSKALETISRMYLENGEAFTSMKGVLPFRFFSISWNSAPPIPLLW